MKYVELLIVADKTEVRSAYAHIWSLFNQKQSLNIREEVEHVFVLAGRVYVSAPTTVRNINRASVNIKDHDFCKRSLI